METSRLCGMDHRDSGWGDPGTMAKPAPDPEKTCVSLATTRPVLVVTVVATACWFCTYEPTFSTWVCPGCRTMPWKLMGCRTSEGVTKVRSTTSGVEVGLNRAANTLFDPAVVPLGKYHCWEVPLWHGDCAQPDGPWISWDAATPPPERATVCETHDPAVAGGAATSWPPAGTDTGTAAEAPVSEVDVMEPATARGPVLVQLHRIRRPVAPSTGRLPPAQYQADDSACAGALTMAP